jgi:hypothetical protein
MSILCPLKIKKEPIYLTFHKIVSRSTTAPADFCLHHTPIAFFALYDVSSLALARNSNRLQADLPE